MLKRQSGIIAQLEPDNEPPSYKNLRAAVEFRLRGRLLATEGAEVDMSTKLLKIDQQNESAVLLFHTGGLGVRLTPAFATIISAVMFCGIHEFLL
ncbi:MAG: hypothetical protein HY986_09540 [Candidatus Melainabacteria bacterium]|nr:hypothetical protein [Candidatus Melainabacteria bacterium]